jgi:hypothetical protein
MASAASSSLQQAASGLEQDARMFPGHGGETAERARDAASAAARLQALERAIDRSMPRLGDAIGEGERQQLRGDVDPQRAARGKAEGLGQKLQAGSDGSPISPTGERDLQQIAEAMKRAERSLEKGDPQGAGLAQQDASEGLRELAERMGKRARQGSSREGQQSSRRDGVGNERAEGPVRIPSAGEHGGPIQRRRRLLDAMREPAPPAFENAVEEYYRELLR